MIPDREITNCVVSRFARRVTGAKNSALHGAAATRNHNCTGKIVIRRRRWRCPIQCHVSGIRSGRVFIPIHSDEILDAGKHRNCHTTQSIASSIVITPKQRQRANICSRVNCQNSVEITSERVKNDMASGWRSPPVPNRGTSRHTTMPRLIEFRQCGHIAAADASGRSTDSLRIGEVIIGWLSVGDTVPPHQQTAPQTDHHSKTGRPSSNHSLLSLHVVRHKHSYQVSGFNRE